MASLAAFNSPGIQSSGCCVGQRTLLHRGRQVSSVQCWVWKDACEFRIPELLGLLEWGAGENVGRLASGPRLLTSFLLAAWKPRPPLPPSWALSALRTEAGGEAGVGRLGKDLRDPRLRLGSGGCPSGWAPCGPGGSSPCGEGPLEKSQSRGPSGQSKRRKAS